jgi:RHS repeat-associated protein
MSYNPRLQPNQIQYFNQTGNLMSLQYSFVDASGHNNGNVIGIANYYDPTRSQQFTYDQLNRLVTAETTSTYATSPAHCWGEAYVYDNSTTTPGEFGNLTNINVASTAYNGCTQESLSVVASASNQLTAFSYDASGNVLNDTHNSYTWNAESEIKTAAGVTYTYDGDGNRLQKSSGKIYWYGAGSEVLDESDVLGNFTDEYVYFGGKRIAHRAVSTNALYFYGEDMLGSSRTLFTSAGVLCYDADFSPWGVERAYTNTCPQNYKFESKERDTETSNDDFGARYYSSSFARWTSPDWSAIPEPVPYANLTNPQTLNLYAMVRDNPETFADLDGHLGGIGGAIVLPDAGDLMGGDQCEHQECSQQGQNQNQSPGSAQSQTAQPSTAEQTNLSAAVGALPLMGRAIAGAELGAETGAEGGTAIEPGGGTVVGAAVGAVALATAAALSPNAYTKTKDALDKVKAHIETTLEHLGPTKLGGPDQRPRNTWKDTLRKTAGNMDKQADKIANKNLANAVRFTADVIRTLAE